MLCLILFVCLSLRRFIILGFDDLGFFFLMFHVPWMF